MDTRPVLPSGHRMSLWLLAVPVAVAASAFGCTRLSSGAVPLSAEQVLGPVPVPAGNPQTSEKVELGKVLFFDKRLSGGNITACASCHQPDKGWSDGLPLCAGCERNSISLFNAAYEDFPAWDGFADSLEEHNAAAITFDQNVDELVKELSAVPEYQDRFGEVFGGEISLTNVIRALGAFERSVLTFNSAFDRFRAGDRSALTKEEQEGLALFSGKAACSSCHTPPLFTDNGFHALGVPQAEPLTQDLGRFAVTGD
ncbi:MAG: cytochrome-c peroxidase, partial [Acidimicrobiia bacterium]